MNYLLFGTYPLLLFSIAAVLRKKPQFTCPLVWILAAAQGALLFILARDLAQIGVPLLFVAIDYSGVLQLLSRVVPLTGFMVVTGIWQRYEQRFSFASSINSMQALSSLVLGISPALLIYYFYNADYSIAYFVAGFAAVNLLFYIKACVKNSWYLTFLLILLLFVLAASIFIGLVITPLTAYLVWFEALETGRAGGLLPLLFAITAGFFTTVLSGFMYRFGYSGPVIGIVFVLLFIFGVMHQNLLFLGISIVFLGFGLVYLASAGIKTGLSRLLPSVAVVFFSAFLVSIPITGIKPLQGSDLVDIVLSPYFRELTVKIFPDFPFLFSMAGYGHSFDQRRIGGRPALSSRAVFLLQAPRGRMVYLRTQIFDEYTGSGWMQSEETVSTALDIDTDIFFTTPSAAGLDSGEAPAYTVTLVTDFYDHLPHVLDHYLFNSSRTDIRDLRAGGPGSGFILERPLIRGDRLEIFESDYLADLPKEIHLHLPQSLPLEIAELAARLSAGIEQQPQKILSNIETYLAQNYTYSLEVDRIPPEAVDAGWDFLFGSQKGYCTHFATAYVLLARLNNIPARYVSGFIASMPIDRDQVEVTGLAAHAWPEVWVDSDGWITKEATPPMNPLFREQYYGDFLSVGSFTARQLETVFGPGLVTDKTEAIEQKDADRQWLLILVLIPLVILPVIFIRTGQIDLVYLMPGRDSGKLTLRYLRAIVRHYSKQGFPVPANGGWEAWALRIVHKQPDSSLRIRRILDIAVRFFYARKQTSPARDPDFLKLYIRRGYR